MAFHNPLCVSDFCGPTTLAAQSIRVPCRITIGPLDGTPVLLYSDSTPGIFTTNGRVIRFVDADTGRVVGLTLHTDREIKIEEGVLSPANEKKVADAAALKAHRQAAQVRLLHQVATKIGVPLWKLPAIGAAGVAQLVNLVTDKGLPKTEDVAELFDRPEFVERQQDHPPANVMEFDTVFGRAVVPGKKTMLDGDVAVVSE